MNKTLQRQLKRSLGLGDEAALAQLLEHMQQTVQTADPVLQGLLQGFGDLLTRVDTCYAQYERDLELRTRSLEISSTELSTANDRLRLELNSREAALRSLRDAVRGLLPRAASSAQVDTFTEGDLEVLSRRVAELVTERERSRRALSNQKFALDQHAIVSITDRRGVIVYANDRFCEISGYEREMLIGQNHRIVNSGTHPAEMFRDMWGTISLGQVWHGEICNRSRDGSLYWVNATIVPLLDEDGQPEQYIAIRTDISDTKRMETQLSEQLHLVEELIEAIPLPLYFKDENGRYLRVNRAFELFVDTPRERIIGQTIHTLLSAEDARQHVDKDAELLARRGTQTYEATLHSRDGLRRDTIYRKAALTRRDGSVSGLLGAIIDITERKQAEREILQAKEAAEAASRAKSDFLANMSHEIRTPMNGIIGMTDLALDTALSEEQREYLGIVKSSAESLLTIINDILDFSKIEAGKLLVEQISFDLPRVVADTLKTLALRAHEKNLELVSDIAPDVPRQVIGDPSRLRQVLLNLIGNAIKFTDRGEIALRAELANIEDGLACLHFSVRDTGIGIPPAKQQLIFEAFSQEDTSTTRKYGGTGLGLSISRRLVELMGGEIWLHSQPGEGSTFHFSVCLDIDSAPPAITVGQVDLHHRRVLVVDDNATNRHVLCRMLANWGMVSQAADSGPAALSLIAETPEAFDCILLDAHMPNMDGYELACRLHAEYPRLPPMLMLSSGGVRGDAQRCQEAGISGFFSKPIAAEELLAALCRTFGLSNAPQPARGAHLLTRHALRELQRTLDVLLVEDHPVNQKLALGLLEKWGHRAVLANHGQEALDMLTTRQFDVILMDMQMPVMGGVEATRRIRQLERDDGRPPTPIIAMTAAAMQTDREACLAAGMTDYLAKPIKARELMEKLLALGGQVAVDQATTFDYGEALRQSDQETVEIIAGVFIDTWPRDLARLREALASDDMASAERLAHSLRGTLASFGAEPAMRLAEQLESQCRQHQPAGSLVLVASLEEEIGRLQQQLSEFADSLSG